MLQFYRVKPIYRVSQKSSPPLRFSGIFSFKVTCFGVNEEPLKGYIVQYKNGGLECEGSEDIASERSENRHIRRPHWGVK